jgi:alpha-galactosidase
MRIAFIGAGSVGFTQKLVRDILTVPELKETEISLQDISQDNLEMVKQLLEKDISANGLPAKVLSTTDRAEALAGAKYVINCSRIGGLEAFRHDIEIPLKYGVDQCVGDTVCAGGILYGQRSIPAILDFCEDIRSYAETDALFLNYANPMAMNTWAALDYGKVNTIGLCHGVQGGARLISEVLGAEDPKDLEYVCSGINHMTWYVLLKLRGRTINKAELLEAFYKHPKYSNQEKVRIDVLERFGVFSTESNGHLSEYLPWYRKRPEEINSWIDLSDWIHGETGGYLRVCTERRNWFEDDFPRWLDQAGLPLEQYERSTEHCSYIIEAQETGRVYRGHFNTKNNGVIKNLPDDCIIESTGFVDLFGMHMASGIELPMGCASACRTSIDVQRMSVEAAIKGDVELLKLALLHDPLVGAVCSPEEVWAMADEMLIAQAQWLPQYEEAIEPARQRLSQNTVKTRTWSGAARKKVRNVAELQEDIHASLMVEDDAFQP